MYNNDPQRSYNSNQIPMGNFKAMRVLFLPNWRVDRVKSNSANKQSSDVYVKNHQYWFFEYWPTTQLEVKIIDCGIFGKLEKKLFKVHFIQAIHAWLVASKYDIIISHGGQSGLPLAILRKLFSRKKIPHLLIDVAAINGGINIQPILALTQFAAKNIDYIVYHAKMQQHHYKQYFPDLADRSCFIPFGIQNDFFKPSAIQKERNYILSFGYHDRDWETLITAYKKSNINTKLVIIGPKSINIPLPPNVLLHKAIPVVALKALINNSKFIIIPLTQKKYAHGQMSVLQAMAFAKPVITADTGAITDYVRHGEDALLYQLGDSNSLAEQILELENNIQLRKDIGVRAIRSVRKNFDEETMGKRIYQAIQNITSRD